jgi:hypothetical protein
MDEQDDNSSSDVDRPVKKFRIPRKMNNDDDHESSAADANSSSSHSSSSDSECEVHFDANTMSSSKIAVEPPLPQNANHFSLDFQVLCIGQAEKNVYTHPMMHDDNDDDERFLPWQWIGQVASSLRASIMERFVCIHS